MLLQAIFNPVGFVSGIFDGLERAFNSPEHSFKKDLDRLLEHAGLSENERKQIKELLNSGKDEEIGQKLRALMSAGIIPPALQGHIAELADRNGVPASSINRAELTMPIEDGEMVDHWLGAPFRDRDR